MNINAINISSPRQFLKSTKSFSLSCYKQQYICIYLIVVILTKTAVIIKD